MTGVVCRAWSRPASGPDMPNSKRTNVRSGAKHLPSIRSVFHSRRVTTAEAKSERTRMGWPDGPPRLHDAGLSFPPGMDRRSRSNGPYLTPSIQTVELGLVAMQIDVASYIL